MTGSANPPERNSANRFSGSKDGVEVLGRVVSSTMQVRIRYILGASPYRALHRQESLPERLQRLAVNHARRFGAQPGQVSRLRASLKRAAAGDTDVEDLVVELASDGNIRFSYKLAAGRDHYIVNLVETSKSD